jgi:hypothetical protein
VNGKHMKTNVRAIRQHLLIHVFSISQKLWWFWSNLHLKRSVPHFFRKKNRARKHILVIQRHQTTGEWKHIEYSTALKFKRLFNRVTSTLPKFLASGDWNSQKST